MTCDFDFDFFFSVVVVVVLCLRKSSTVTCRASHCLDSDDLVLPSFACFAFLHSGFSSAILVCFLLALF